MKPPYTFLPGEHPIKQRQISRAALDVIKQLHKAGFDAYLVGGAIRDIYLGLSPKDFDVATNATPEQVKACFKRQARIIGRRFQIVHVRFGREIIEVTTFRGSHEAEDINPKKNHNSAVYMTDFLQLLKQKLYFDLKCNSVHTNKYKKLIRSETPYIFSIPGPTQICDFIDIIFT